MLKIKIEGSIASGKTSLAGVLAKALLEAGYKVSIRDEGMGMGMPAARFKDYIPENNDGREVIVNVRIR